MTRTIHSGFTLIELLIVIAIIGVLVAILVPNLLTARLRALDSAAIGCARQISTAEAIYRIDFDSYAADLAALDQGIIEQCDPAWVTTSGNAASFAYTVKHDGNASTRAYEVTPSGID